MDSIVSTRELAEAVNSYNDVTLLDSAGLPQKAVIHVSCSDRMIIE